MPKIELSLQNPAIFVSTMGGIGHLPKAPGTWASLLTLWPVFLDKKSRRISWFGNFLLCHFYSGHMGVHKL
jgi:hypothetical protein